MAAIKVDLVGVYERFVGVPLDKCTTEWSVSHHSWLQKDSSNGFNGKIYNARFEDALRFLGIDETEYYNNENYAFSWRTEEALCRKVYEIYKEDWYKEHNISDDDVIRLQDEWQFAKAYDGFEGSFEDYEQEFGYNGGEVYACFDEFLDNEFEDCRDVVKYNPRKEVENVVYNWLDGFRENGLCVVNNLDIDSGEYKDMVRLVEGLCSDEFPELYEAVFGSDSGSIDLIFRDKHDEDGFNLYYYNPDSVAGGQIVQCPFDREDAPEMVDNEDYIDVLARNVQYLADVNSEHFFNDIFELFDLKDAGLYLGDYVGDVCRNIVAEVKLGVSAEEIYKHQCEISNLRHELEGALMYDPDRADDIEKILERRVCELDALLSGKSLDEVLADAKDVCDKQANVSKGNSDIMRCQYEDFYGG